VQFFSGLILVLCLSVGLTNNLWLSGDTDSDDEDQIPQLVLGSKSKPIVFKHTFKSLEESSNLHV
jgi:hypothetical protein